MQEKKTEREEPIDLMSKTVLGYIARGFIAGFVFGVLFTWGFLT